MSEGRQRAKDRRVALSDENAKRTIATSREVIIRYYAAIRVMRFHDSQNEAVSRALSQLVKAFEALFQLQYDVSILYYAQDFYVNETRIKVSREVYEFFAKFSKELELRQIGGLNFRGVPKQQDLVTFIRAYEEVGTLPQSADRFAQLNRRLREAKVSGLTLSKLVTGDLVELPVIDARTFVKQTYFRAVDAVTQLYDEARKGRPLTLKVAKRIVQNFVDVLTDQRGDHEDLVLLLTEIKCWQGYLPNHAVNTCILALGLGKSVGLGRLGLRDLGMAALLCDIGNAAIPEETLDAEKLSDAQWKQIEEHPLRGVPIVTHFAEMDTGLLKAVVACLQHHKGADGTGYPDKVKPTHSLYARIIAIADKYDAMTTPRPYRPSALRPPEAVQKLATMAGKELDPVLVRVFIHWLGTIPAGTVVAMPNGDVGLIVKSYSRLRGAEEAIVRVLFDRAGKEQDREVKARPQEIVADPKRVAGAVAGKSIDLDASKMNVLLAS